MQYKYERIKISVINVVIRRFAVLVIGTRWRNSLILFRLAPFSSYYIVATEFCIDPLFAL